MLFRSPFQSKQNVSAFVSCFLVLEIKKDDIPPLLTIEQGFSLSSYSGDDTGVGYASFLYFIISLLSVPSSLTVSSCTSSSGSNVSKICVLLLIDLKNVSASVLIVYAF